MQKIREHYEQQDTEELLGIAGKDLTDEARAVLHEVLATRGVATAVIEDVRKDAITQEEQELKAEQRLASGWSRIFAFAIDVWGASAALFVVLLPLRFVSENIHANAVVLIWIVYFLLRDSIPGQSIGKRILKLRAIQAESGKPCTWSKSFWRNLTHMFFFIDAVFALGQRRKRLGDVIASTVVIRATPDAANAS